MMNEIELAYNQKRLNDEDMKNIQIELLQLLDERVYRYNGLDSSSIKKETMDDIAASNLYTIGVYLRTFKNFNDMLECIKTEGMKKIFQKGRKQIDKIIGVIKIIYAKVKKNMVPVMNDTYNDTILKGIKGFLKVYDPDYKAQDMKITADYPLYDSIIGKFEGAEFIKEYLISIDLENEFCNKFNFEKITQLLYGYSKNYDELVINIFEIVLTEAIACKLAKRSIHDLCISSYELDEIYKMLKDKEENEVKGIVITAYEGIKEEILTGNKELQRYIERNINSIMETIILGTKNNTLNNVFVIQKFIEG